MEENVIPLSTTVNLQTPEGRQVKKLPWLKLNIVLGVAAVLTIFLLAVWFMAVRFNLLSAQLNTWNNIIPGETTKTEVIKKLGNPLEDKIESFGQVMTYDSGIKALPNTIIYDKKTGKVVGTLVTVTDKVQAEKLYQEMLKLGKPEKVMYSTLLQFSRIYIFAQKGITYSVNEELKRVDGLHCYPPTTLTNYLSEYGKYYSEESKFQD